MDAARLLFGLRERVDRRAYVTWGIALATAKFLLDTGIVYAFTGHLWSPLGYVIPSITLRQAAEGPAPQVMLVVQCLGALPFLWIGLSMSIRRAADSSLSPWVGALFVVPVVNYAMIAVLACVPTRPEPPRSKGEAPPLPPYRRAAELPAPPLGPPRIPSRLTAALGGVLAGLVIGVAMLWVCALGLGVYGVTLFFVTPFAMGVASSVLFNRRVTRGLGETLVVAAAAVMLAGSSMLLFAIEGLVCLVMAAPLGFAVALAGAACAWEILRRRPSGAIAPMILLALPGFALGEARLAAPALREVTTAIEVDAPPERVWPAVIAFGEIGQPPEWFFRLGVAYPTSARIDGAGVGAVRRCEFSTGAFVEPITGWAPPSKLAFDVVSQPPSLTEWSPYRDIRPPHLEGYMVSRSGEFDLTRLPGGRTRLEGTTRYTLAIYPGGYWRPFAEAILHAIHRRVLGHIKALTESAAPPGAGKGAGDSGGKADRR
jgi:uncharacterized membrane protein YhaH (DUF805 family)